MSRPCSASASRRSGVAVAARRLMLIAAGWTLIGETAAAASPPDFAALRPARLETADAPVSRAAQSAMRSVPAGRYPLGRNDGPRSQRPEHHVELAAFRIDRTEVTNAAFAEFLNALALDVTGAFSAGALRSRDASPDAHALLAEGARDSGRYPLIALDDAEARIGWRDGRFSPTPGYEDHPVAETTWAGARAYCLWRGARLPTEAEWEAAARGPEGRLYPWGDAPPEDPRNDARVFVSGRSAQTGPVGARPDGASPFGALDMAGSLAEWTSSLKRAYPYDALDGREDPTAAGERVTRGGDYVFDRDADELTATHRDGFSNAPERGHRHIGVRCAADAPGV